MFLSAKAALRVQLFTLGFLILFLELVFIRFLAGNVWNLGYFPNLVLLCAFIGLGVGFLSHDRFSEEQSKKIFTFLPLIIFIFCLCTYQFQPGLPGLTGFGSVIKDELWFTAFNASKIRPGVVEWGLFLLWGGFVVLIFAALSQYIAKVFVKFKPLEAYSLDIGGSICGIIIFIIISLIQIQAHWWFVLLALAWWIVLTTARPAPKFVQDPDDPDAPPRAVYPRRGGNLAVVALIPLVFAAVAVYDTDSHSQYEILWSPYQKISYDKRSNIIYANNINHQQIKAQETLEKDFYQFVYNNRQQQEGMPPYKSAMIIGSGSGNDVATALLNGVDFIHAVEIDPVIQHLGVLNHPYMPYQQSDKVSVTIDDGRHALFLEEKSGARKYDLIIFALTDSLVKTSPVSQLRLENYLFTKESFQLAWDLLNPNGSLILYNFYRTDWLINKIGATIQEVTGQQPIVNATEHKFAVFVATKPAAGAEVAAAAASEIDIATDDWPFLYLRTKAIPQHYLWAIFLVAMGMIFVLIRVARQERAQMGSEKTARSRSRLRLAFVLMGSAFLLLQTKSVIQFSLLFGTTWITSSMVFLGSLCLVLCANFIAWRMSGPKIIYVAFVLMMASCAVSISVPISFLLDIDNHVMRAAAACLFVFAPMFFANLMFSATFRDRQEAEKYFGWNLAGGPLGGLIEYTSMLSGYHVMSWLVLVFYITVFVCILPEFQGKKAGGKKSGAARRRPAPA